MSDNQFVLMTGGTNEIQGFTVDSGGTVRIQGENNNLAEPNSWPRNIVQLTSTLFAMTSWGGNELFAVTLTTQ